MFFTRKRLQLYLGALLALQLCTLIAGIPIAHRRYIDFRTFYAAGFMLRTGHASQLYDYPAEQRFQSALVSPESRALPMMSAPFTSLFFAPLSQVSFWSAYSIFVAFNILLLLASFVLIRPFLATLYARWKAAPLLLSLTFLPAAIALIIGQLSFLLLVIVCACFVLLRHERDLIAGLILSFALMKFQIALPIAFLFLLWRQWRFFSGFLIGGAILTSLSLWIIGVANFSPYIGSLYSMTQTISTDRSTQLHFGIVPSLMPNFYGFVFVLSHGAAWSPFLVLPLSLLLFVWTAFQRPSLPLALLTTTLICYHLLFYDLTLLLLPLSLLADRLLRDPTLRAATSLSRNYRLLVTQISLGTLLIAPFIRILIAGNDIYWLALPILALTLCSPWWPTLHGSAATASDRALDLAFGTLGSQNIISP